MNTPRSLFGRRESKPTEVGRLDSVCPYCENMLEKRPGRKKKCPHCGNFILVRTRPSDRKRVLVTEEQADFVDEQWAIHNGTHDVYLQRKREYEDAKASLRERLGCEPLDSDVRWNLLNLKRSKAGRDLDWGTYSLVTFDMAEFLRKEGKVESALEMCCEACYLWLNGPTVGSFDSRTAFVAPAHVDHMRRASKKLGLSIDELQAEFERVGRRLQEQLKVPRAPSQVWRMIEADLRA